MAENNDRIKLYRIAGFACDDHSDSQAGMKSSLPLQCITITMSSSIFIQSYIKGHHVYKADDLIVFVGKSMALIY